ncbi:AI-2E family transporter [Enterobacteriaceae bacterium H11S18]|uniref:AI-2E family transporter n=1 Tax=Dryocola clanedunensis TaxID=2925396 RepID=UPI0022F0B919|nr:AI-2E family transporter [Dryocola clanedunensis]MCT4706669.1 AI-2E family transporter [Dryocola clanedunensis]MCT4712196.1 AI-2E family transporter [Dryocola clanedunensis]
MEPNDLITIERRIVTRFLDMFIKFGLMLALASFCFTVFSPFLNVILWGLILAVTLYPLHQYFAKRLGGKQGLASTVLVLLGLLIIVVPTIIMITSLGESTSALVEHVTHSQLVIPPPGEHIGTIPVIGGKLYEFWLKASTDLPGLISVHHTQVAKAARLLLAVVASMGGSLLGFVVSLIAAGVMMAMGAAGANSATRIAMRITDEKKGPALTKLCTGTIRAVAQGVIGVALLQSLLTGIIMILAGIPAAGIFFIGALILGIAQVPLLLVTLPAIIIMWMTGDHGTAMNIVYTVLLVVAGMVDNVLKPMMLGRGVDAPMPVVLIGALGGMAADGILGMFIGATLLSIGYLIFMAWVNEGLKKAALENASL